MNLKDEVAHKIRVNLTSAHVEIVDESAGHAGHDNPNPHFAITVTWQGFEGKALIDQHQMIYDILKEEMKTIHSLRIKTKVK
jgi:BolA family transcriptional regulator, general stress-responsive regulator